MSEPAKRRSVGRRILGGLIAALGLLACGPSMLLLVVAETRAGRLFGGIAACLLIALVCLGVLLGRVTSNPRAWWLPACVALALGSALLGVLIRATPTARPERSTGLISRFADDRRVPRLSPFHLLPEIDQVKLGVTLATRLVPWAARARTIREVTMAAYREIEAGPGARGLPPVSHFAALELAGADFRSGHYFAYVPELAAGERPGAVILLHGNGGNFQLVPWAWRSFAESHHVAILCPTFGFGFWGEGGVEAVERAWLDASRLWGIDPDRVYLAGISDGGAGVTRSALAHPDRYRGLIYISPTMNLEELGRPAFEQGWRGRPVLVFQGDRDWSVWKSTVDPAVDLLRKRGVDVNYQVYPGEDHFLFFSRRTELFETIGVWMAKAERRPVSRSGKAGKS